MDRFPKVADAFREGIAERGHQIAFANHTSGERLTAIERERDFDAWVRLAADHIGPTKEERP